MLTVSATNPPQNHKGKPKNNNNKQIKFILIVNIFCLHLPKPKHKTL
jgi:hypothetical protein